MTIIDPVSFSAVDEADLCKGLREEARSHYKRVDATEGDHDVIGGINRRVQFYLEAFDVTVGVAEFFVDDGSLPTIIAFKSRGGDNLMATLKQYESADGQLAVYHVEEL